MRPVAIWDLPTRLFHWPLVVAVVVAYATGGEEGRWFVVHLAAGYAIAALVLFRLGWGLIGSPRSRFSDFVYGWPAVRRYAQGLSRLRPSSFIGHNPLGGWMVVALLAVLAAVVVSGLFAGERGEVMGPLAQGSGRAAEAVKEVHEVLANVVIILAGVHVAAVFLDWAISGDNLVGAMIHGRKTLDETLAAREAPLAGRARAVVLAGAVLALLAAAVQRTDFGALAGAGAHAEPSGAGSANSAGADDEGAD
jgi:cytochrome b